jgi:uncharacterized protein
LKLYLDTSVLVSLFVEDAFSRRADEIARQSTDIALVSNFAAAEFASAVARLARTRTKTMQEAQRIYAEFDMWSPSAEAVGIDASDIRSATVYLRQLNTPLRAPDAIHIAAAQRLGAELATFDKRMAEGAAALGLSVIPV